MAKTSLKTKTPVWSKTLKKNTYVNSVGISNDGSRVVAGNFFHSYNGSAKSSQNNYGTYCFDKSGKLLYKDVFSAWEGVYWTAISGDENYIASGGWQSQNPYFGFIKAYDINNKKIVFDQKTGGRVNKVTLSQDGTYLLAASDLLYFAVKNTKNQYGLIQSIKPMGKDGRFVTSDMSADGKYAVACDQNGNVTLYQNSKTKLIRKVKWGLPNAQYSNCVQMTRNGNWFIVGGHHGFVYAFNIQKFLKTGKPTWQFQAQSQGTVYGAYISESGEFVSTLSNGYAGDRNAGEVALLQVTKGKVKQNWFYPTLRNPNSTTMDAAAKYVTVADGHPDGFPGHFYLIERETGKCLWIYKTDNMSWPMEISQDGSGIAAGSDDANVYYFAI